MIQELGPFYDWLMPPLVLTLAFIVSLVLPAKFQLATWIHLVADALTQKVLNPQRDATQQRLAGWLSLTMILLPFVGISTAIIHLAAFPQVFELLLIALCLPGRLQWKRHQQLATELHLGRKQQARLTLAPFTLRQTDKLSEVGLLKAAIESRLTHEASTTFLWLLYYPLLGLELTLTMAIIQMLHRHWFIGRKDYQHFGMGPALLSFAILMPINLLLGLTLSLYGNTRACLQQLPKTQWQTQGGRNWLLTAMAYYLNVQLGGPWQLDDRRLEFARLGPNISPQPQDLIRADKLVNLASWLWLAMVNLIAISVSLMMVAPQ